jgi:hypothetical protein
MTKEKEMGAWSAEPFGNDTACDWAYELPQSAGLSAIETALNNALGYEDDYLDASDGEEAIAALEVMAKLRGKGTQSDSYTEAVDAWVAQILLDAGSFHIAPSLLDKAQRVLLLIQSEDSELSELWEDDSDWDASLKALSAALSM